MTTDKHRAYVLKKMPYREADLLVTFLVEPGIRQTALALAGRSSRKRFGGDLDLFNCVDLVLERGRGEGLSRIRETSLVLSVPSLREDLSRFACACYFSELVLHFIQDRELTIGLFDLFSDLLQRLGGTDPLPTSLVPLMEQRLLTIFGFKPVFDRCLECGEGARAEGRYFFSGSRGGVLCSTCHDKVNRLPSQGCALSYSAIRNLLQAHDPGRSDSWGRTNWKPREVAEARRALEYFIQYTAGRPLKSLQFLSKVL